MLSSGTLYQLPLGCIVGRFSASGVQSKADFSGHPCRQRGSHPALNTCLRFAQPDHAAWKRQLAVAFEARAISFPHEEQFPGTRVLSHEDGTDPEPSAPTSCDPELGNAHPLQPRSMFIEKSHRRFTPRGRHRLASEQPMFQSRTRSPCQRRALRSGLDGYTVTHWGSTSSPEIIRLRVSKRNLCSRSNTRGAKDTGLLSFSQCFRLAIVANHDTWLCLEVSPAANLYDRLHILPRCEAKKPKFTG